MAEFIFWLCLLLPVYAYLGYPLLLTLLAPLYPAPRHGPAQPMDVSIVIAAHNEARHIEEKLRTVLAQDYQPRSLHIILDLKVALRVVGHQRLTSLRTIVARSSLSHPTSRLHLPLFLRPALTQPQTCPLKRCRCSSHIRISELVVDCRGATVFETPSYRSRQI